MEIDFRFEDIVESAHDIIIVTKPDPENVSRQKIVYVNPAFTEITEYTSEEAVGKYAKLLELFESDTEREDVRSALENKVPARTTIRIRTKSGKQRWLELMIMPLKDRDGHHSYFASIERDVTNEKKLLDELEILSRTDPLTGLLNRRALHDLVNKELSRYKRTGTPFCFLLIDLDYFKNINDTYGHASGDKMLKSVAMQLTDQLRPYDFAARTGGEEFCIVLSNTGIDHASTFARRLRRSIADIVIRENDQDIQITPSIGITEVKENDNTLEQILKRADVALYQAKASGRNCIVRWDSGDLKVISN